MTSLTTQDPIRLVQITDTHLYGTSNGTLLKMNTHNSFAHVLDMIREKEDDIDLILATGDIAQDASPEAYDYFLERIGGFDAPLRWVPGNHDKTRVMQKIGEKCNASEKKIQINNWLVLLLDSSVEGQVHGKLAPEEIRFLEQSLEEAEGNRSIEHCLVALHHNPTEGNAGWMKDIGLQNAEEFFDSVTASSKARCVVYGHIHQDLDYQYRGIRCLCTPSTCIQFKPHVKNFELDRVNPGYRSLHLHEGGKIETRVYRFAGTALEADFTSTGY